MTANAQTTLPLLAAALFLGSCARTQERPEATTTMNGSSAPYASAADWIGREAIPFSPESGPSLDNAVDRLAGDLGGEVELLGFGEALHGGEEILLLRNRLFRRLAEAHGFSAIAVESSCPRSRLVDDYVAGRGPASYDAVREKGFSHGFGALEANRELVEWMRSYNADPAHPLKLRFYGFDSPTEMTGTESPRGLIAFVLDYLDAVGGGSGSGRRERIEELLGRDADWENPAAMMDPSQSIGLSPAAAALRIETEDLIAELSRRRPELTEEGGADRFAEALHYAGMALSLLGYHAAMARDAEDRISVGLGLRDAMMAENLDYALRRERERGRVLAFAHNMHLQRSLARWQLGPQLLTWWPAGAQLGERLGRRYAVIGTAIGVSEANGIGRPEAGTLEALLTAGPSAGLFIPTRRGGALSPAALDAFPVRTASARNQSYFALAPRSLSDFDWLAVLDATGYSRGGPPLP